MSDDADVIRKMIDAWFAPHSANYAYTKDMARVLAVVRAHDAGPARRVPVQIVPHGYDNDELWALASDGNIYHGWFDKDKGFAWRTKLPDLPQGDDAWPSDKECNNA